jgi:N-acetylglutamate synthase-like GNAT family acetyltransferase
MPLYLESFGENLSARLTGRPKVVFDVKEENLASSNKVEAASMYTRDGKILGKVTYAILPDNSVEIQGFAIDDWIEKNRTGNRMLVWFIGHARKRGFMKITGGIFSTDTRTADKLEMFRQEGFEIKEMGSMAGHNEYHVELLL